MTITTTDRWMYGWCIHGYKTGRVASNQITRENFAVNSLASFVGEIQLKTQFLDEFSRISKSS